MAVRLSVARRHRKTGFVDAKKPGHQRQAAAGKKFSCRLFLLQSQRQSDLGTSDALGFET